MDILAIFEMDMKKKKINSLQEIQLLRNSRGVIWFLWLLDQTPLMSSQMQSSKSEILIRIYMLAMPVSLNFYSLSVSSLKFPV